MLALGGGQVRAAWGRLHHDAGHRLAEAVHVRHGNPVRRERAQHLHLAPQRLDTVVREPAIAAEVDGHALAVAFELAEPGRTPALLALGRHEPRAHHPLDLAKRGAPHRIGEQALAVHP